MMATSALPPPSLPLLLPCLVLDYGGAQCATLFGVSDAAHRACDADELRGKRSWPTSHGWVLACDLATAETFLWNPRADDAAAAGRVVPLPPLAHPHPAESVSALSGRPSDAGGCTVVLVEPPQSTVLWYCHAAAGDDDPGAGAATAAPAWSRHEYDLGGSSIPVPEGHCWCKRVISRLASRRGRFYYFHSATEYGVIDFPPPPAPAPPAFSTVPMRKVPIPYPAGQFMAIASMYPLDIGGELYTASVVHRSHDVNSVAGVGVYRMDFARKRPVRVKSIGDRAIVVGSSSCFGGWCPAAEFGLRPNTVYWMSPEDMRVHVWDIGTGVEEEVHEPCNGVAEPSRQPFWMIPEHS